MCVCVHGEHWGHYASSCAPGAARQKQPGVKAAVRGVPGGGQAQGLEPAWWQVAHPVCPLDRPCCRQVSLS